MIFNKKRLEEQYQNIVAYLSVHQDIVSEIEGLKKYHENALLDEKIVKTNGVLMAIYYYYLEDIKEEALKMKTATEEEKKEIQIRIESDKFFIDSLEKSMPIYHQVLNALEQKNILEKKLGIASSEEKEERKV